MEVLMSDLVKEMRIAMDEVIHDEVNDIITDDSDTEMKQAIETAAQQILLQAPAQMILPKGWKFRWMKVAIKIMMPSKHSLQMVMDAWQFLTIGWDW